MLVVLFYCFFCLRFNSDFVVNAAFFSSESELSKTPEILGFSNLPSFFYLFIEYFTSKLVIIRCVKLFSLHVWYFCIIFWFFLDQITNVRYPIGRSTLVGQRPMKSLSSVCVSVRPSIRPAISFLKIGSLVFSDIVRDDSWSWHLVTDKVRFLKKEIVSLNLGPTNLNQVQNEVFCHFDEFGS